MRIGIAGLGFMGSTHLKAYQKIPGVELAAVCSNNDKALAGDLSHIQGNFGGPGDKLDFSNVRKYKNLDEFVADPDLDAVDICLPTDAHSSTAIAALKQGKHVFVEKPLALTGEAADELVAAAKKQNRILMCGQVLRFFPAYAGLREELKRAGKVRSALFRRRCAAPAWSEWLKDASRSGGGIFDLLIHDIDMCLHLFGKPDAMSATGFEDLDNGIDVITANLHYKNVPSVIVTGGWHHVKEYPFSMEYTVSAEEATFDFSSARGDAMVYTKAGESRPLEQPDVDAYAEEVRYFVECCRKNEQPALCPPQESADAVKLALLMRQARAKNGEKIPCEL